MLHAKGDNSKFEDFNDREDTSKELGEANTDFDKKSVINNLEEIDKNELKKARDEIKSNKSNFF